MPVIDVDLMPLLMPSANAELPSTWPQIACAGISPRYVPLEYNNMLLFLVICACLQTLRGRPLLPPAASSPRSETPVHVFGTTTSESPVMSNNGDQQFRTVYDIVQSCLLTIFACVWTSIHPNINGPRDSWWSCAKRRAITTFYAVMAPEMVFLWALEQRVCAKKVAEQYNNEFAADFTREIETYSISAKVRGLFRPLPESTTRRGAGQPWTITHGFFLQMGGFMLYEHELPKQVLEYERLAELLRDGAIDAPIVTEADLQDRSKGDSLSKCIVVLQTTWFVIQCIARRVQHLPLSELEVLTLAFAVVNAAVYAVWWEKPLGVGMAICIPLKRAERETSDPTLPISTGGEPHEPKVESSPHSTSANQPASTGEVDQQHSNNDLSSSEQQPDMQEDNEDGWLRHIIRKDLENYPELTPFYYFIGLPWRIFVWVHRPFAKILMPNQMAKKTHVKLRMPMFYAMGGDRSNPTLALCVVGTIFGAIHLLGWALDFPSHHDLVLWRVSAIMLTATPFMILSEGIVDALVGIDNLKQCFAWLFVLLIPSYSVARCIVIIIALKAIHHPPNNVLLDVSWTKFIPHL